jgi:hypothetical protein
MENAITGLQVARQQSAQAVQLASRAESTAKASSSEVSAAPQPPATPLVEENKGQNLAVFA